MVFISQGPIAVGPTNITTQNLVPAGTATANSAVAINPLGRDIISIQVTGTYTGALSLQKTTDGTNWETLSAATTFTRTTTGVQSATIASASTGQWYVSVDGAVGVRVTALAAVTGTAAVTLVASDGNALVGLDNPLPAGANVIGGVTGSGNFAITNALLASTAAGLGKAEDAAHASGDVGVMALAVRNDNAASADFGANADYTPISVDAKGVQFVRERAVAATKTTVTSSATSVTILAANASRRSASIRNSSTAILYLDESGATATSAAATVEIAPGGYYELPFPASVSAITGIWASANGQAVVVERV